MHSADIFEVYKRLAKKPQSWWRRHYCNQIVDPSTCCDIGGHSSELIPVGFDHPRCTCPKQWKEAVERKSRLNTGGQCAGLKT